MTKRVGHTGTLDPDATGVLVVLIGRAAKAAEYIVSDAKAYRAVMRLGLTSDTEDISGNILSECADIPDEAAVLKAAESFTGEITQIPPMYSALKVGGQKLVNLARRGIEVERQPRSVNIFRLDIQRINETDYALDVECSKGTYIRTLCADIGAALGCGAVMACLERTRSGVFTIEKSYTVGELEALSHKERVSLLVPTEALFSDCEIYKPEGFFLHLCVSGCELYQYKLKTAFPLGAYLRLYDENGFFALGRVEQYEEGTAIKAVKFFRLTGNGQGAADAAAK